MFQTYSDHDGSIVYEERDQQSINNEECLEEKVQSKLKTKFNVHVCEIQHSMQHGIHCIYGICVVFLAFPRVL